MYSQLRGSRYFTPPNNAAEEFTILRRRVRLLPPYSTAEVGVIYNPEWDLTC